jgi:hypothetical protein
MLLIYNSVDTRCYGSIIAFVPVLYNYSTRYMVIILSDDYLLPIPVGQIIVLKMSELNAHSPCWVAAGSAKEYLSEKIKSLYKTVTPPTLEGSEHV